MNVCRLEPTIGQHSLPGRHAVQPRKGFAYGDSNKMEKSATALLDELCTSTMERMAGGFIGGRGRALGRAAHAPARDRTQLISCAVHHLAVGSSLDAPGAKSAWRVCSKSFMSSAAYLL